MNTLKRPKPYLLGVLVLLFLPAQLSFAQTIKKLNTSVSVMEQYDDNIFLQETNEQSDYLTKVASNFDFRLLSEHTELGLLYAPTFVRYVQFKENTVRHNGTLSFKRELSEHFRFHLNDIFIYSDDALGLEDVTEGREGGDRNTREDYTINMFNSGLSYLFGQGDTLILGYNDRRIRNDDDWEQDGNRLNPYATITYSIDIKNQLEIGYGYTKVRYWGGNLLFPSNDYSGHDPKITYFHKFTPHTKGSLGYRFTARSFTGHTNPLTKEEDYNVHEGIAGFEHSFSPDFSISAGAGYFVQKRDVSSDQSGPSYSLSLTKKFERGHINIGGRGGWNENSLLSNRDNRGFSEFWSAETSGRYQLLQRLKGHARLYYRHDKNDNDITWKKMRGNCGLSWLLLPRFSLMLDYDYNDRTDDIVWNEYTDHRVTLSLRYSKPFQW